MSSSEYRLHVHALIELHGNNVLHTTPNKGTVLCLRQSPDVSLTSRRHEIENLRGNHGDIHNALREILKGDKVAKVILNKGSTVVFPVLLIESKGNPRALVCRISLFTTCNRFTFNLLIGFPLIGVSASHTVNVSIDVYLFVDSRFTRIRENRLHGIRETPTGNSILSNNLKDIANCVSLNSVLTKSIAPHTTFSRRQEQKCIACNDKLLNSFKQSRSKRLRLHVLNHLLFHHGQTVFDIVLQLVVSRLIKSYSRLRVQPQSKERLIRRQQRKKKFRGKIIKTPSTHRIVRSGIVSTTIIRLLRKEHRDRVGCTLLCSLRVRVSVCREFVIGRLSSFKRDISCLMFTSCHSNRPSHHSMIAYQPS